MIKKNLLLLGIFAFFALLGIVSAQEYIFYYGNGCTHCAKVEEFFDDTQADEKYDIASKEVYFNATNRQELLDYGEKLGISQSDLGVPFLIIDKEQECSYIQGDKDIISFFDTKLEQDKNTTCEKGEDCPHLDCDHQNCDHLHCDQDSLSQTGVENFVEVDADGKNSAAQRGFFGVMVPAALADSINPCAFAVILILLGSILSQRKKRKTAILSGLLFSGAIFVSYLLMGLGVLQIFGGAENTAILKIIIGILGIIVGLANLKDYFRYGKGFVMEVPHSRRPKMKQLIKGITSPIGALLVGFVVSLFLLPCTSGPYLTILGYLGSQGTTFRRGIAYLVVYNLIFVLPMIVITILVASGKHSAKKLMDIKKDHDKLIHLIVGLLMLGLGIYVLIRG